MDVRIEYADDYPPFTADLGDFIRDNSDELGDDKAAFVAAIMRGETVIMGGGASPMVSVKATA